MSDGKASRFPLFQLTGKPVPWSSLTAGPLKELGPVIFPFTLVENSFLPPTTVQGLLLSTRLMRTEALPLPVMYGSMRAVGRIQAARRRPMPISSVLILRVNSYSQLTWVLIRS